jgi:hypothetical protein
MGLQNKRTRKPESLEIIKCIAFHHKTSRGSSVGIKTGRGFEDRGPEVRFPTGVGIFLFSTASRPTLGSTKPPIQCLLGALSPAIKRPVREAGRGQDCVALYLHPPLLSHAVVLN